MSRILIVEDDPAIAIALEDDLRLEGYSVEVARDGQAAVERGRRDDFDLILLDIMLPKKDGFDVCRELRHAGVASMILLLTARMAETEKVLGLELGADDYVTKPYSPRELRARIRAVLRRFEVPEQDTYCFGDVEVDFARAEVRRNGQTLDLTKLEFKLLETFIRRRGRLLTRDQLLDAAWDPNTHVTNRAVDAHIVNLRRKIEPHPAEPR